MGYEWDPTRPKWEQIAEQLHGRIASGEYPPRHRISEVELEAEFEVARITVRKAVKALRDAGLLVTRVGMGSFVVDDPPADPGHPPA